MKTLADWLREIGVAADEMERIAGNALDRPEELTAEQIEEIVK